MSSYSVWEAGGPAIWDQLEMKHPAFAKPVRGKGFLAQGLGLTGMEVSLNNMPPGAAMPFLHTHREHEELYVFLSGRGEMWIDGDSFAISAGTTVRVAPEGKRCWRNTGDEPLTFVVIQARAHSLAKTTIADGVRCAEPAPWSSPARSQAPAAK